MERDGVWRSQREASWEMRDGTVTRNNSDDAYKYANIKRAPQTGLVPAGWHVAGRLSRDDVSIRSEISEHIKDTIHGQEESTAPVLCR